MEKKVVLVTGAARGTGEAVAQKFLTEGAIVIATDVKAPTWQALAQPENLHTYAMDVADEVQVTKVIQEVAANVAPINVLVNNAGVAKEVSLIDETSESFDRIFNVNMKGVFFTTREVCKILIEKKLPGAIINIASVAGKNGFQNTSLYGASKAAVIGFTRNLSPELGPYDITINAVCPGSVDTDMLAQVFQNIAKNAKVSLEEARNMMKGSIPMRRLQQPADIAALVSFLASEGARNISGESINVDGGAVRD